MKKTIYSKRNFLAIIAIAVTSMVGFTACENDETSNPTINIQFSGNTESSAIPASRSVANTVEFSTGTIRLTRIQFEAETDDTDSVEVEIERVVDIDFATGETTPNLESLVFPVGTFEEVRVELELLDDGTLPSIVLDGTFTDASNESHPLQFEFTSGETFELEKSGRINIGEGARVLAEVTFDPVQWFTGITSEDLAAATKNEEGIIVISERSNAELFDIAADGLDLASEVEITL